jgi:hypothetical protein
MPTSEELEVLKKALAEALGELRVVRTERDLLKEQLNRFKRQLFEAKSEVSAAHQKDLFFNEAEVEGAAAQPAKLRPRARRSMCPRTSAPSADASRWVRPCRARCGAMNCRKTSACVRTTARHCARSAWRSANSWTSCRSRCA